MSRRGNCYDNVVAESFFQLFKRERISRKVYKDHKEALQGIFNCLEMLYNLVCHHGCSDDLPPVAFEKSSQLKQEAVH